MAKFLSEESQENVQLLNKLSDELQEDEKSIRHAECQYEQLNGEQQQFLQEFEDAEKKIATEILDHNMRLEKCNNEVDAAIKNFESSIPTLIKNFYHDVRKRSLHKQPGLVKKCLDAAINRFNVITVPDIYKKHGFVPGYQPPEHHLEPLIAKITLLESKKDEIISEYNVKVHELRNKIQKFNQLRDQEFKRRMAEAELARKAYRSSQHQKAMDTVRTQSITLRNNLTKIESDLTSQQKNRQKLEETRLLQQKNQEVKKKQTEKQKTLEEERKKHIADRKLREKKEKMEEEARKHRLNKIKKEKNPSVSIKGLFGRNSHKGKNSISSGSVIHSAPSRVSSKKSYQCAQTWDDIASGLPLCVGKK